MRAPGAEQCFPDVVTCCLALLPLEMPQWLTRVGCAQKEGEGAALTLQWRTESWQREPCHGAPGLILMTAAVTQAEPGQSRRVRSRPCPLCSSGPLLRQLHWLMCLSAVPGPDSGFCPYMAISAARAVSWPGAFPSCAWIGCTWRMVGSGRMRGREATESSAENC